MGCKYGARKAIHQSNVVSAVTGFIDHWFQCSPPTLVFPLRTNKLPALCVYNEGNWAEYNQYDRTRHVDYTVDLVIEAGLKVQRQGSWMAEIQKKTKATFVSPNGSTKMSSRQGILRSCSRP